MFRKITTYAIIILNTLFIYSIPSAQAQNASGYQKVILVVTDSTNPDIAKHEEALKNYLVYYRQKYGYNSQTLPVLIYDFNNPKVRDYCIKQLGIKENELLLLGIATAKDKLPRKLHFKIKNPVDLENNAKKVVEKAIGKQTATGSANITSTPSGANVWLDGKYNWHIPI